MIELNQGCRKQSGWSGFGRTNVRSLVGVVICDRLILVGVVVCYRPTQCAHQCSVWIQSSWRTSNSYNKQVSESLNTRLKPRLEGKQRPIDHHHHGCINVDNTIVPTKPNQLHPLPNLCIVNNCRTNFRTWPTWKCLLRACKYRLQITQASCIEDPAPKLAVVAGEGAKLMTFKPQWLKQSRTSITTIKWWRTSSVNQ